ncbi:ZMYM2 protein, partial [Sapayoa aenigma]|nr:ZMYM2 protein [Sapayoa aenigma]
VPVPVFLPATLDSSEKIHAATEELRGKVPTDPLETELLNLSGMVPEHVGKAEASDVSGEFPGEFFPLWSAGRRVNQEALPDVPYEPDLDIEIDFPRGNFSVILINTVTLWASFNHPFREALFDCRIYLTGVKRKAVSEYQSHDDSSENSECSFPFKYAYGVNAWKHWVKSRYLDEELPELEELKSSK